MWCYYNLLPFKRIEKWPLSMNADAGLYICVHTLIPDANNTLAHSVPWWVNFHNRCATEARVTLSTVKMAIKSCRHESCLHIHTEAALCVIKQFSFFFFFFGSYIVKQFVESDSSLALIQWTESYSLLILLWLFLFPFGFFRLSYIQSNTREARWGWRWFMSYCSCQHWHSLTPLVHFTSTIKAEFPKRHSCSENYATLLNSCHWQKKKDIRKLSVRREAEGDLFYYYIDWIEMKGTTVDSNINNNYVNNNNGKTKESMTLIVLAKKMSFSDTEYKYNII